MVHSHRDLKYCLKHY